MGRKKIGKIENFINLFCIYYRIKEIRIEEPFDSLFEI